MSEIPNKKRGIAAMRDRPTAEVPVGNKAVVNTSDEEEDSSDHDDMTSTAMESKQDPTYDPTSDRRSSRRSSISRKKGGRASRKMRKRSGPMYWPSAEDSRSSIAGTGEEVDNFEEEFDDDHRHRADNIKQGDEIRQSIEDNFEEEFEDNHRHRVDDAKHVDKKGKRAEDNSNEQFEDDHRHRVDDAKHVDKKGKIAEDSHRHRIDDAKNVDKKGKKAEGLGTSSRADKTAQGGKNNKSGSKNSSDTVRGGFVQDNSPGEESSSTATRRALGGMRPNPPGEESSSAASHRPFIVSVPGSSIFSKGTKTNTENKVSSERTSRTASHPGSTSNSGDGALTVPRSSLPSGRAPTALPGSVQTGWTARERQSRAEFLRRLRGADEGSGRPTIQLKNDIDHETPSLDFQFIAENVLREGVNRVDDAAMVGCTCKPENGRGVGCEYTSCECLQEAATKPNGKKRFPYYCTGPRTGCLQEFYLNSRNHIFECNRLCNCPPHCKNKIVQRGRSVALEIFKTANRGWGLRTLDPLRKGQFIDTYRGEIITSAEADKREKDRKGKDSYLYVLDKFQDSLGIPLENCYIIDGEFMGGAVRFMNHSCDPNCRQFTVSYNHADVRVYEIALFAIHDIPAGTELTFNYTDSEDVPGDDEDENNKGVNPDDRKENQQEPTKCLCGSANCKGFLWM